MSKKLSVKTALLSVITFVLWAAVFFIFVSEKTQQKTTNAYNAQKIEKAQAWSKAHPQVEKLQGALAGASYFLRKSVEYKTYSSEKSAALVEIDLAEAFVYNKTGQEVVVSFYAISGDDLGIVKDVIGDLRAALNDLNTVEEDALTAQEKNSLHAHLQTALDKMLQVQQAEQKSQPEKSNP